MKPILKFTAFFLIAGSTFFSCKKEKDVPPSAPIVVNPTPSPVTPSPVPIMNTQLIPVGELTVPRRGTAAATAGSKIFFAGGYAIDYDGITVFSRVDIYEINTQTWSKAELSQARYNIVVGTAGNKIIFAGGVTATGWTTRMDIYDVATNNWTTAELPETYNIVSYGIVTVSSGNKIFFVGAVDSGTISNHIDIYDASLNAWSTATLSEARNNIVANAAGTKVLFAGGWNGTAWSNRVDIYDTATHIWSTASLSQAITVTASATVGDTIFFLKNVGGYYDSLSSDNYDMYDASSGNRSVASLAKFEFLATSPTHFVGAATSGNFSFFAADNLHNFIIHNSNTGAWSMSSDVIPFDENDVFVTANKQIYMADGSGLYRVQF
jgi:hypothetical protein